MNAPENAQERDLTMAEAGTVDDSSAAALSGDDGFGLAVRLFSWGMLAVLAAFLINNYLSYWLGMPGASLGGAGLAQAALYLLAVVVSSLFVLRNKARSIRREGQMMSAFNVYLVSALFWGVFLVGATDAAISFLRVEEFLPGLVGEDLSRDLGRSLFRGPYIHMPLMALGFVIALFYRGLGFQWLALLIVVAELAIVLTRFVFSYEQAFMGDLVRFWYAALFLFSSAHTLLAEGHVRVDVFYAGFTDRRRAYVNAFGSLFMGIALCWTILIVGMGSKSAIINSPMINYEVTQTGFGMYVKYLMAGFLGVFAVTMLIQFTSYMMDAIADLRDEPGKRKVDAPSAH